MSLKRKVLAGLGWTAGARLLGQLLTWPATIIVMRLLTPVDYGLMALALSVVELGLLLNELGLPAAIVQAHRLTKRILRQVLTLVLGLNAAIALVLVAIAPWVADFYNEPRVVPVLRAMSLQFIAMAFTVVPAARLRRHMRFKELGIANLTRSVVGGLTTLALAYFDFGVWSLVFGTLAGQAVFTLQIAPRAPRRAPPTFNMEGFGAVWRLSLHNAFQRFCWFVYENADVFIIGRLLGTVPLGVYSVSRSVSEFAMGKVGAVINSVGMPAFGTIRRDMDQVAHYTERAAAYLAFASFPVYFGIAVTAEPLVLLVLGEKWAGAIVPVQILAFLTPLRLLYSGISSPVMGIGRPDITARTAFVAAVLLPTCFLVGSQWGILGICWGWLVGYTTWFAIVLLYAMPATTLTLRRYFAVIRGPLLSSAIMGIVVTLVGKLPLVADAHLVLRLLVMVIVGVLSFGSSVLVLDKRGFLGVVAGLRNPG